MASPAFDINSPLPELVETTLKQGPLVLTKEGIETAVLVSIDDWKIIQSHRTWKLPSDSARTSIKDVLLDPNAPHDIPLPPRGWFQLRPHRFEVEE